MRLIVSCPVCRRQYDATGRPIGGRFRCRCGELVTIDRPHGHDASVVRCSSCGAPRHDGSRQCSYCGADFTLREQDLDTICPHCLARISDRAKFCDHCGSPLAAEPLSVEETALCCPTCGAGSCLHSRLIDGNTVLECPSCAGIWVGAETFRQMIRQASREGMSTDHWDPAPVVRHEPPGVKPRSARKYVPCPVCGALMVRQNFAHRSNVIIDFCKHHGCWFDGDKLSDILEWVRVGGLAAANEERQIQVIHDARVEKLLRQENLGGSPFFDDDLNSDGRHPCDLAVDILASLFGR